MAFNLKEDEEFEGEKVIYYKISEQDSTLCTYVIMKMFKIFTLQQHPILVLHPNCEVTQ